MVRVRGRWAAALVAGAIAVLAACSSSGTAPSSPASAPTSPSAASPSADAQQAAVQKYLDAVNALCDALLPKVVAVTKGGSLDIPLKEFFAQLPGHTALRRSFDRDLAQVPVPAAARDKARALSAYIRFANQLDARRLSAAKKGNASYRKEIRAELKSAAADPTITARDAAGFSESCNAR